MTVNTQQLGAWLLRIVSLGAVVIAAIPATDVPASVRPALAAAGAIILAVDRYLTDPSTGSTPTTTTPEVAPPVVTPPPPPPAA